MDRHIPSGQAILTINGVDYPGPHDELGDAFWKAVELNNEGKTSFLIIEGDGQDAWIRITASTQIELRVISVESLDPGQASNVIRLHSR